MQTFFGSIFFARSCDIASTSRLQHTVNRRIDFVLWIRAVLLQKWRHRAAGGCSLQHETLRGLITFHFICQWTSVAHKPKQAVPLCILGQIMSAKRFYFWIGKWCTFASMRRSMNICSGHIIYYCFPESFSKNHSWRKKKKTLYMMQRPVTIIHDSVVRL